MPISMQRRVAAGMTLMEVVVALSVVAVIVPLVLAAMTMSLETRSRASEDTRGTMIAREIFEEVPFLWSGRESGILLASKGEAPDDFPDLDDTWLLFDASGTFVKLLDDGGEGVREPGGFYVVKLSGEEAGEEGSKLFSRVTVEVQAPAQAAEVDRRKYQFVKLLGRG